MQTVNVREMLDPAIRDPHSGEIVGRDEDVARALEAFEGLVAIAGEAAKQLRLSGSHAHAHLLDCAVNRVGGVA
ncbi:hypothetical protein [Lysobacter sp. Hz 25]|uniref:hypothetical protein n=1 Tax=Lysobacter sp. Hz 25 TaxID=3383698 RepID=UPI0038D4A9F9